MREERMSGFGKRTLTSESGERQAIKKYFLLYEGSETEGAYFREVNNLRDEIKLSSLIELVPIIRSFSEEGWSNPRKILDKVIEDLEAKKEENMLLKTLFDKIIDYFRQNEIIANSR